MCKHVDKRMNKKQMNEKSSKYINEVNMKSKHNQMSGRQKKITDRQSDESMNRRMQKRTIQFGTNIQTRHTNETANQRV